MHKEGAQFPKSNANGFLDMLVGVLCEHEKRLSDLVDSLAEELELARVAREARKTGTRTGREQSETERDKMVLR